MALKNINDKDLVEGDAIKYHCEKCNKNVVMKIIFSPEGMLGKCCSCRGYQTLKKNENYFPENKEIQPQNVPKCPTCNSTNVEKISGTAKVAGAVAFGLFSKTARSQFKCKNCGYMW